MSKKYSLEEKTKKDLFFEGFLAPSMILYDFRSFWKGWANDRPGYESVSISRMVGAMTGTFFMLGQLGGYIYGTIKGHPEILIFPALTNSSYNVLPKETKKVESHIIQKIFKISYQRS